MKRVMSQWRRSAPGEPATPPLGRGRPRVVLASVVAACVAVTGIAITGAGHAPPGLDFAQAGHWIYQHAVGTAFHLDGGSKNVDAEVRIPGAAPDSVVVQTDRKGYVLSQDRIIEFGKSDLRVADPLPAPADEQPVGLEAGGAAFAIYPNAGQIVRFGEVPTTQPAGGRLGQPVVTGDGTLWVHRLDGGQLCRLQPKATRLSCTATTPTGHNGHLTVVDDQPVFVDTTANTMTPVSGDGLGRAIPLRVDVPDSSLVAAHDVGGRIAILDPDGAQLHLVDGAAALDGEVVEPPASTRLEDGEYEQIGSSGDSLALIDEDTNTLVTLDEDGNVAEKTEIPPPNAQQGQDGERPRKGEDGRDGEQPDAQDGAGTQERPRLFRGEDERLYVDSAAGEHVMVVEDGGEITPVPISGDDDGDEGERPASRPTPDPTPTKREEERREPPSRTVEAERTQEPEETVAASRPGAPTGVRGEAGVSKVEVSWGAADGNGAPVTSYVLSWSGGSKTVSGSARSAVISGLRNGSSYQITVRAVNRVGAGPGVSTPSLRPGGAAAAPPNFRVRPTGPDEHVFSWGRPALHGGELIHYQLVRDYGENSKTPTGTSQVWGGLIDGKSYHFSVRAVTRSPDGTVLVGKPATMTFTVDYGDAGGPKIVASKGPATTYGDSCDENCHFVEFLATGLEPNTEYTYTVYASEWGEFNSVSLETDENGREHQDDRFAASPTGQEVWIVAEGPDGEEITSNKFVWTED